MRPTGGARRTDGTVTSPWSPDEAQSSGTYLYCVADTPEEASLGRAGLEGEEVFTVPCRDICGVVQRCPHEPYQSSNEEVVKGWVLAHQRVVEAAWRRWGTVLPSTFDTIFQGDDVGDAERTVRDWLETEYDYLRAKMQWVKGKAEYGVQISWDHEVIGQRLTQTNPELFTLNMACRSKPGGTAFLNRERLKSLLRGEMEAEADRCFQDLYRRIRDRVDDLSIERAKKGEQGLQMILNLSCLASKEQSSELGRELGRIDALEGFFVRFTGPWPPYSFVGRTGSGNRKAGAG